MINRVIKRDGQEVVFNDKKILNAISAANKEVSEINKLLEQDVLETTEKVVRRLESLSKTPTVEDVQNIVEEELIKLGKPEIAKKYIVYRYERALARKRNTTDASILSLVDCKNEEIKQENSNKNPTIASVQRDYVAGEVSKDISRRFLIPEDIMKAHDDGVIHFHDSDYFLQRINNCGLVNLEDMLQNGTVISGTMIEKPHSFHTACNIATQVIAQVASSQFGLKCLPN